MSENIILPPSLATSVHFQENVASPQICMPPTFVDDIWSTTLSIDHEAFGRPHPFAELEDKKSTHLFPERQKSCQIRAYHNYQPKMGSIYPRTTYP